VRCANCHRLRTAEQFAWRHRRGSSLAQPEATTEPAVLRLDEQVLGEWRTCTLCHRLKPLSEFYFKDRGRGTRRSRCRPCVNAYGREHYRRNRDRYLGRAAVNRTRNRNLYADRILRYLLDHPCVDCGENNPLLLDFDHRESATKLGNIGELSHRRGWNFILAEIAKCDVRCANCHRRRTAVQFGWSKLAAAS
jgi:hypothetical protein